MSDGGLRSTVERRNFWIYTSKLTKLREQHSNPNYYQDLVQRQQGLTQGSLTEIGKDVGRTFPDLKFFQKG